MVVTTRRKTCFVPSSPFAPIPEESEFTGASGRRDSVESGGSDLRSNWARGELGQDLLEGEFTLVSNNNYDRFLAAVGAGPLSSNMVLRARINLTIKQVREEGEEGRRELILSCNSGAGQTVEDPLRDNYPGQVYQGLQHEGGEGDGEQVSAGGGEAGAAG